ncbi:MAG: response regulator [Erysipelothrix sp.]|nr:response regulator [Erysipelothrix sp.]
MYRIVVVEDELTVRRGLILTTQWSKFNCEVIGEAKNGKEGLVLILELRPDIVITDIKMPIMNGLEMMDKILDYYFPVFVILTAHSDFEYAQKALQLGAVDYLLKPFDDEQFTDAITKAKEMVNTQSELVEFRTKHGSNDTSAIDKHLSKSKNSQHKNIIKSIKFISDNFAEDINISIVAEHLNVSNSYLGRLFRKETSYTFHEFLTLHRMKKATEFLNDPNVRIYEVAGKTGYRDQRYFSVVFKKYIGINPSEYRDNL